MGRFILDNIMRSELLQLAREPGCVICRAAQAAVNRFFSWYTIEQYHEPSIIQRMQEARGFCLEHTHQFVAASSPHLMSTVYRDLLAAAASLLRSVVRESSTVPGTLAERIGPQRVCLACEHQKAAVDWIAHGLSVGITDSQVRAAMSRPSTLCLPHFIHLLPSLDWEAMQMFAQAQLASLGAAWSKYDANTEPTELVRLLSGASSEEAFLIPPTRLPITRPTDTQTIDSTRAQDAREGTARAFLYPEQSSWSPAMTHMETLLNASGCPLCREEVTTAATYLCWLSQELLEKKPSQVGDDARWLCRNHLWHFISVGDDKAVSSLLRSTCAYWTGMVQTLISGLDRPPATFFITRCWHGMVDAQHRTPRVTYWRAFWEGIAEGRRSIAKRLAELRSPVMQTHLCPACRFQRERTERLADLLDRTLDDEGIAHRYEATSGVCFRHLPLAIRRCTEPDTMRRVLRTQHIRVAVVHWELEEYWQKLNWSRRWEPKGDEQEAWHRAVAQYTGTAALL